MFHKNILRNIRKLNYEKLNIKEYIYRYIYAFRKLGITKKNMKIKNK